MGSIRELSLHELTLITGGNGGVPVTQPNGDQIYCAPTSPTGASPTFDITIYNVNTGASNYYPSANVPSCPDSYTPPPPTPSQIPSPTPPAPVITGPSHQDIVNNVPPPPNFSF